MAGYIGRIELFDDSLETWASYVERLEQYFALKNIKGEKQVSALLTLTGRKNIQLVEKFNRSSKTC